MFDAGTGMSWKGQAGRRRPRILALGHSGLDHLEPGEVGVIRNAVGLRVAPFGVGGAVAMTVRTSAIAPLVM